MFGFRLSEFVQPKNSFSTQINERRCEFPLRVENTVLIESETAFVTLVRVGRLNIIVSLYSE